MKIGLYFGSFNPIHIGHLIIAQHVVNFHTNLVWFIVSPQNPLKQNNELVNASDRIKLVEAAISKTNEFEVKDVELELPVPSFTINTLNLLKERFPTDDFFIVMGSDNFLNIAKWKSSDILLRDYKLLIYERPGFRIDETELTPNIILMKAPLINISSTEIRALIKAKKKVEYLIPDAALSIIKTNKYYY